MNKNIKFVTFVCLTLILGGCLQQSPRSEDPWKVEARKYSHVKKFSYQQDQVELTADQKNKIKQLMNKARVAGPIYVQVVVNSPLMDKNNKTRVEALRDYLIQSGIADHRIDIHTASKGKPGKSMITVAVNQYKVIEPDCVGWSETMGYVEPPEGERNFGCTDVRNFARMVAEPRDIYEAQCLAAGDGARHARFIDYYRNDKLKELRIEKSSAGAQAPSASRSGSGNGGGSSGK